MPKKLLSQSEQQEPGLPPFMEVAKQDYEQMPAFCKEKGFSDKELSMGASYKAYMDLGFGEKTLQYEKAKAEKAGKDLDPAHQERFDETVRQTIHGAAALRKETGQPVFDARSMQKLNTYGLPVYEFRERQGSPVPKDFNVRALQDENAIYQALNYDRQDTAKRFGLDRPADSIASKDMENAGPSVMGHDAEEMSPQSSPGVSAVSSGPRVYSENPGFSKDFGRFDTGHSSGKDFERE